MQKGSEKKLFDIRLLERNIRKGIISPKEYEKYLSTLEDSKEYSEEINLEEEPEEQQQGEESGQNNEEVAEKSEEITL